MTIGACIPALDDGSWSSGREVRPCHIRGYTSDRLVTVADVDRLICWHVLTVPHMAHLTRDGIELSPDRYAKQGRAAHGTVDPPTAAGAPTRLDADRTIDELVSGATLSLTGVQRQLPRIEALLREISQRYAVECSANLYLSGPGSEGGLHRDPHDVLVVQLSGSKLWGVQEPSAQEIDSRAAGSTDPPIAGYHLQPGDALFVASGWPHQVATPPDGWSLHVAVGIRPLTADRLGVDDVLARNRSTEALDHDSVRDPDRFAVALAAAVERRLPDGPDEVEALRARAVNMIHRSGPPDGRLAASCSSLTLSSTARLVPRGLPWVLVPDDHGQVLHADGRSLLLPEGIQVVLATLLDGYCLDVSDLVDALGVEGATVLVRGLIAQGFVRCEEPQ